MASVRATLRDVAQRLASVTDTPELEAEIFLTHQAHWTKAQLLLHLDDDFDGDTLNEFVERRLNHEPVAYILGVWEFFSLELSVEPPLLVPRPETEHLVEIALAHIVAGKSRVLDLCTGTGCVALAIAHNAQPAVVWATDVHDVALRVATANAQRHGVEISFGRGDLFDALPDGTEPFDVIVSNPPYVEDGEWSGLSLDIRNFEDPGALLSGIDGLDCIRRIVNEAPEWLHPGGVLAMEMGERQGSAIVALMTSREFADVSIQKDLAGHDRVVYGTWLG